MSGDEALEHLRAAAAETADACAAYSLRAHEDSEPLDYRLASYLSSARHYLSAALVAAGDVPLEPSVTVTEGGS